MALFPRRQEGIQNAQVSGFTVSRMKDLSSLIEGSQTDKMF